MIEILDIKMKKGQELLEERAQKIFSKPFIELTEKERNHLNVVKVKARCSAVLNHIKITGIELTDLGGRDVLFMPLTGKNEQCVQIINKEDLECLKRKINELYENNSTLCTVENSNTEIRITDIIINMLFGASEVKAECALIINDSIKFEKIKIVQNEKGLNIIKPYRKNQEGKRSTSRSRDNPETVEA